MFVRATGIGAGVRLILPPPHPPPQRTHAMRSRQWWRGDVADEFMTTWGDRGDCGQGVKECDTGGVNR